MKNNKIYFLLLSICLIMSCKAVPSKNIFIEKNFNQSFKQTLNLQIYFPLFTDSENEQVGGDGIVIIFPNKEVMIIDGFYPEAAGSFISFLKDDLKIEKIDYLVATHFHGDHIGTFPAIIDTFEVKNFYSNGAIIDRKLSHLLVEKLKETDLQEIVLTKGDKIQIGEVNIDVLWPNLSEDEKYAIYYEPGKTEKLINLSSLVMKLSYKDFSILFTGDIYKKGEKELVKEYGDLLKSTILKAPHHGDPYTSNSRKFLLTVNPELTIAQAPADFLFFTKARFVSLNKHLIKVEKPGFIKIETTGFGYTVSEYIEE